MQRGLATIAEAEMGTYIYHELGELQDTNFDRDIWREIVATFPHTPIELLARTIKDFLADTNEYGTLRFIIRERKISSLAFYVAFHDGLIKELFPEIIEAFQEFTHNTAKHFAEGISNIYQNGKQKNNMKWAENEIGKRFLEPLGIKGTQGAGS